MTPNRRSARRSLSLAAAFQTLLTLVMPLSAQSAFRPVAPDPAAERIEPTAWMAVVQDVSLVARVDTPSVDKDAVALEDESSSAEGLPPRFAIPTAVLITPATHGT